MKPDCLTDRDLILLHYGETPDRTPAPAAAAHLAACAACQARRDRLARELARIPAGAEPDPHAGVRIAARVNARLHRPQARWLPPLGGALVAATVLVVTFVARAPQPEHPPVITTAPAVVVLDLDEEMPDADFLEDLELLRNLDLLQQIKGG